jgi:hypothetical protein
MRFRAGRLTTLALCLLAGTSVSSAYYHFIRYNTRTGPFVPVYEKFDLNALPNKTINFFISAQAQVQLAPNDSFAGLVSQVRSAAKVWNDVNTSDLRIRYGGTITPGTPDNAPSIEIVFDEVPPGLIAFGAPTILADNNGSFVPIIKSVVTVRTDLTQKPSYGESLYGTLVHEIGHALGLQHTLTSTAMSTSITRATSRSKPLATDDIAAISLLYPTSSFQTSTGSITGRVTLGGQGVNLASVVAISPSGPAVSALTRPDGTYRIDGLPPRQYLVYVHPLPPAQQGETYPANIIPPTDSSGQVLNATGNFETQFFPGTKDAQQAYPLAISAGASTDNVNFSVVSRGSLQVHSVQTYGFPGNVTVKPPYLNPATTRPFIVATGAGLVANSAPATGLTISMISGAPLSVKPYPQSPDFYLQVDVDARSFLGAADSPRHLVFSLNNDIYVLPYGFFQVQLPPPALSFIGAGTDATGNRTVTIAGSNLSADTKIYFDGIAGTLRSIDESGRLIVIPPAAPSGYRANVVAVNPDGQDTSFLTGDSAPTYSYDGSDTVVTFAARTSNVASISANLGSLPAGTEALIQIDGVNTNFVDGQVVVGFGSSDVVVRRVWVISPTKVLANVAVNSNAAATSTVLSVTSGLQVISQPSAFQAQPASSSVLSISSQVLNASTGLAALNAGSSAVATVLSSPSPISGSSLVLSLNDRQLQIGAVNGNQFSFLIPADVTPGQYALRLDANGQRGLPIGIVIDPPPPQISGILSNGQLVDSTRAVHPGDALTIQVTGLADPGTSVDISRIGVNVGGIDVPVTQVLATGSLHQVNLFLPISVAVGSQVPVTVAVDGRTSAPSFFAIRSN